MPDDTSILHTDARVRRLVEEARAEGWRAGIEAAARLQEQWAEAARKFPPRWRGATLTFEDVAQVYQSQADETRALMMGGDDDRD